MTAMTRREAMACAAALAALPATGLADDGPGPGLRLGPPKPFAPGDVLAEARARAARPWQAPRAVPAPWRQLDYDTYRQIWFDTRNALWRDTDRPAWVDLLPPGLHYPAPVTVNAVDPDKGTTREILFDLDVFDRTDKFPDLPVDDSLGYSGLRLLGELERPGIYQEYAVYQGASYFRAIGRGQVYGLSARGIAVDTVGERGEEFPEFRAFWIEAPAPGAEATVIHALLDGPSVTGAYRFAITPGEATVMDVSATLFPRRDLDVVGLGTGTSMFLFDQTNRHRFDDYRPAVHDSDGLMIWNGAGERLWRPLKNPATLQVSSFVDDGPRGFGLMQRARAFEDFADLSAKYHLRPGLWVEPGEDWGPGAVTLVEIPADREVYDNIVAYWQPHDPLPAGEPHDLSYRLSWCDTAPVPDDRAPVLNTRMGRDFSGGMLAAIDFAPHPALPEDPDYVRVQCGSSAGRLREGILQRNPQTGGLRLDLGFDPDGADRMELRAQLLAGGRPVSEVWLYRWTPE